MAKRVVAVTLSAQVAEYERGMLKAAEATRTVGTEGEKLAQQRQAFEMLGRTMLTAGGLMAAGVGLAIAKFAEFDQQMSYVAATGDDARANLDALREAAIDAGASTVFTAAESANAIEEMAKAGINAADILGGALTGSLDLAAAGGLGVARAAEVMSTTMQQFSLSGEDATHVADLLAAGAGKAMGDVEDMSQALNQSGLVASQFGISVEETTGTLAAFAQAGLLGSDAGTSMRTMLLRLANPTEEVKNLMSDLGLSAYDSQGQFIGMANLAGELEKSLRGMTDEQKNTTLAMIFGQDAIRSANILLREGEDGIRRWTRQVDDQGYAAETASTRLDNLKGDIEALGGAVDSAFITMGSAADGPGRLFIQMLTSMVDNFNDLPDWGQQAVFWVGAVAAAVALGGGAFFTAVPKMVEYRGALDELGPAAQRTSRMVGLALKAMGIAAATMGITTLVFEAIDALNGANATAEELNAAFTATSRSADSMWQTVGKGRTELGFMAANLEKTQDVIDHLKGGEANFWSYFEASDDVRLTGDRLMEVGKQLATIARTDLGSAVESFGDFAKHTDGSRESLLGLIGAMGGEFKSSLIAAATEAGTYSENMSEAQKETALLNVVTGKTAGKVTEAAGATKAMSEAAEQAETDLKGMKDALAGVGSTAIEMGAAIDDAQGSLNDLANAAAAESVTLDGTNDSSIAFRDSLREVEQSHRDAAQAILDNGGTFEQARDEWNKGREAIINQMTAMGMSREAAVAWADQNLGSSQQVVGALSQVKGAADAITSPPPISLQVMGYSEAYNYLSNIQQRIRDITNNNQLRIATGVGGGGGTTAYANGGIEDYAFAAGGGIDTGIFQGGPPIYKIAEPETGWEAFISGKADQRSRNIGIWQETGRRLGVESAGASSVSIEGATITGRLDLGNGLTGVIDGRILSAQYASKVKVSSGEASL